MKRIFTFFLFVLIAFPGILMARNYPHIVGSSAVFPFVTIIAEEFSKTYRVRTPIVESTGTGSGIRMFCSGTTDAFPDIVNSSRPIRQSEIDLCSKNGVENIFEIKLGYDAIIIGSHVSFTQLDFSREDLFLGLSSHIPDETGVKLTKNSHVSWSTVNNNLPDLPIEVYGPIRNTGTYETLVNQVFWDSCIKKRAFRDLYKTHDDIKQACSIAREDGRFIEVGYDQGVILKKMSNNKHIMGIFSYNFLQSNLSKIQIHKINGVLPDKETIKNGTYPLSRPIYVYFKTDRLSQVKDLAMLIKEMTSNTAIGSNGYLSPYGLVSLEENELDDYRTKLKPILFEYIK